MPYKDPEKRKQADKERKRRNRHKAANSLRGGANGLDGADAGPETQKGPPDLSTVAGIRDALARALHRLELARLDPVATARAVSSLAGVALRICEGQELQGRVERLEFQLEEQRRKEEAHHGVVQVGVVEG